MVNDREFGRWSDGVPVEALEGPQGPPFVVVGGRRLALRGMPLPYPVSGDHVALFPKGPEVNVGAANCHVHTFRRAMYGRYQMERLRAAVARKGVAGTAKEAARRQRTERAGSSRKPVMASNSATGLRPARSRDRGPETRRIAGSAMRSR